MRIVVIHNAYQFAGGEDTVVRAEVALLRAHGHTVQEYRRSNNELHGISLPVAGLSAVWSRRSCNDLEELCRTFEPDVIHVHNTLMRISPSVYWAAAKNRVPVVQTLHNFRLLCPQGGFLRNGTVCEECLNKTLWRPIARKCYRGSRLHSSVLATILTAHRCLGTYRDKVTRYIALSEFSRNRFIAGGLPAHKFRVKPNFVESPSRPMSSRRRGGLFVGRLSKEKGIETLLAAIDRLGDTEVMVAGEGAYETEVANRLGSRYLGCLSSDEVTRRMRSAAFLVLPSIGHEQMPMTVLEAFANGLPVIASRRGALAHIVEDGITGLLVEPEDTQDLAEKMRWASTHDEYMEEMGRAARADYEHKYTAPINYKILMDIYEDAIAAAQGRGDVAQRGTRSGNMGRCIGVE
jgi:glycosyltransferase involved in cell wall biosynthesis